MGRRLKVFFDGGCRPNPGLMEAAVVIRGKSHFFNDLGTGSNSDAEWRALFCAIRLARHLGEHDVAFIGDSKEVISEANLAATAGHARSAHAAVFLSIAAQGRPGRIRWIKREQNLAGIALEARRRGLVRP
jgi:ribonuclease HI